MKISIRWALILGFLGLIWGTQIIITSSTYFTTEKVLLGHSRDIMQNIADLTMEQSENHLALAHGAAHLTKRLIVSDVVGSEQDRLDLLEKYFLDQLALYPHFAGIYVGTPNGDFFYVNRSDDRSPDGFRTKIISHFNGQRQTLLKWRDKDHNIVDRQSDANDTYDPRQRPWYKKALAEKSIVWTDPYIFFTSQKPGITIAGPVYHNASQLKGIVGVDIEIDQLSSFIGKLRIGKSGRAFMLNNNGDVVAFPDVSKLTFGGDQKGNKVRLVKIEELDDGLSKAAYQAIDWQHTNDGRMALKTAQFARFEYGGDAYHVMFTPFNNPRWPWIIGVYLPETDYLGSINANRRMNFWITMLLSVLATLIGLRLAKGVIRPLAGLEKEAQAIKQHDLTQHFDTQSSYKEIQETADSFTRMREALRTSEEKYRGIFENIQDIYYEASVAGRILEVSPSVEKMTPYKRRDLIGASLEKLYADPADRQKLLAEITANGKVSDYEIILGGKDDGIEYASVNAALKRSPDGQPLKIVGSLRLITDRKKADLELRQYRDQLEELVQERTRDLEKSLRRLRREMETRKEKEEEKKKLEARFQRIQRLEGIGTLAGGVAHDFNNLLMGIQGNVSLMLLKMDRRNPQYEKLKGIEGCVTAGASLTRQLLGFARGGKYLVKPIDFNQVIRNTSDMFGRTRKEIQIHEKIQTDLWTVKADQSQIEQVLLNLFVNAWQAMPNGGNVYIETQNVTLDKAFVKPFGIAPGRYIRVSVADSGSGMDETTQQKIFEPFFTTKDIGRGTGLGLASAYGIIKNHDGAIDFVSQPGHGTTFYLYLPATDATIAPEPALENSLPKGSETILLVDDEQIVLDVNLPMLTNLGYTVLTAQGGQEAVDIFSHSPDSIDMVILDMIMPDLGGGDVFDQIKAVRPDIKVLLSSGYSLTGQAEEIMERGCAGFLQKPFTLEEIGLKVREILDA